MLTNLALIVILTTLGAVLNRFRGGGVILLPGETVVPDHKKTQVRRLFYSVFMGLISFHPLVGLIVFLSLITGWGFPVSAAIGKNPVPWQREFWLFDKFTEWTVGKENPHLYGVTWLTYHGSWFGLTTALAIHSPWPFAWCLMGLCYKYAADWERGEIWYGTIQTFTITLFLITTPYWK
jgi:hypothetical protein